MSTGNRLDLVATDWMATGLYYRVHPTLHPVRSGELLSPLEANPASTARLAIRGDHSLGVAPRAMFYVATSPAAALFEALFRSPQMYPGRRVVVPRQRLQGMTLSTVRLLSSEPYVPLMKPDRGLVVHDAAKDAAWQWVVNTPNHADTHAAAIDVAAASRVCCRGSDTRACSARPIACFSSMTRPCVLLPGLWRSRSTWPLRTGIAQYCSHWRMRGSLQSSSR
jgi:hypothetical protein